MLHSKGKHPVPSRRDKTDRPRSARRRTGGVNDSVWRQGEEEQRTRWVRGATERFRALTGTTGRVSGPGRQRPKKNPLAKAIEAWTARLLGAARADGSFAEQEAEYESNRTSQDYLWNTIGLASWGLVFPILTIIVTQLVGVELAGMFSLAFVVGNLLMILANYGARTYQVSDRDGAHSFIDYQVNRWITCALMLLAGYIYCTTRAYEGTMFTMCMGVFVYRAIDGLADCYEGRLQQVDKLYLAGISQTIRSAFSFLVFSLFLLITRDLGISAIAMAIASAFTFVFITLPLSLLETPKSAKLSLASVAQLFAQCFPAFVALFMYNLIDNMPKFIMEGTLSYDNQLYFNALYFPAQAILLTVGFCYKPMLTRMADAWNDLSRRRRFDILIFAALGVVALITLVVLFVMAAIGIPVMSFLYGVDFEQFRNFAYLMIAAGGITGGIDFLYQVFTVMRRQGAVTKLYIITFAFSLAILSMLIRVSELRGAVIGYLIIMAILLVLLLLEYFRIRVEYKRHPEDDPTYLAARARAREDVAEQEEGRAAQACACGEGEGAALRRAAESGAEPTSAARAATRQPLDLDAREIARQERIIREGGEPDPRYRAWRALQQRRKQSGEGD